MATKNFILPSNVTQYASVFSKNNSGYYTGYAIFKPATNYEFETPSLSGVSYTNYNMLVTRANGTTFNIKTTQYCTFTLTTDGMLRFTLLAAAQITDSTFDLSWTLQPTLNQISTPTEITVTQNLSNCTISGLPSTVYDDTVLNLTLTPSNGYEFATAPRLSYLNTDLGYYSTVNFTVNANGTATLSLDLSTLNISDAEIAITANATVIYTPTEITVTQNLQNCTISGLPSTVYENSVLNLTITAANDYSFTTAPRLAFSAVVVNPDGNPSNGVDFTLSNENKTATLSIDLSEYTLDYSGNYPTITITAAAVADEPIYNIVDVDTRLTNCTISGLPSTVYENSVLNLTITADDNAEFENAPQIILLDQNGNPQVINFTLSDNTVATATVDLSIYLPTSLTIYATATVITPYTDKYGSINVYKVTESNLNDFAQKRFFNEIYDTQATAPQYRTVDLGNYVISVKRVYFDLGNTTSDVLKCGNYNTQISVQTPLNDNIIVDCGTVEIPTFNNNIVDYQSEITVFLPFIGMHTISNDYIGKTISLRYICNIVTCECIAVLSCNEIDFDFVECTVSNEIVIHTSETYDLKRIGNAAFNMQVLKGLTPFVIVKYFVDDTEQIFNNENKRVALDTLDGFNKVVEVLDLQGVDTLEEQTEILRLLESGVYF